MCVCIEAYYLLTLELLTIDDPFLPDWTKRQVLKKKKSRKGGIFISVLLPDVDRKCRNAPL